MAGNTNHWLTCKVRSPKGRLLVVLHGRDRTEMTERADGYRALFGGPLHLEFSDATEKDLAYIAPDEPRLRDLLARMNEDRDGLPPRVTHEEQAWFTQLRIDWPQWAREIMLASGHAAIGADV